MNVAKDWQDYEILDMANGEKLERWKNVILVRPDPQIIWTQKSFQKSGKMLMLNTTEVQLVVETGNTIKNARCMAN